jgi:PPIC-type PPIASE domain
VRSLFLACFLLTCPAYGQVLQPGPDDAVITINGFCGGHDPQGGDACRTVVTRAQFESLAEALQPGMPPDLRLKVANAYAQMVRMAAAAEQRGLDKTPAFAEEMRYARIQLLSQDLGRALHEDAGNVTDAEIESYYAKNRASFEEATLARIFVPRAKRGAAPGATDDEMSKVATNLRARAAGGADPDALQIEAYSAAGIRGTAPNTRVANVRRAALPPTHEAAFDLQPGGVSEVLCDPGGGHFIYKMLSRTTLSLADATPEIHQQLAEQRYRQAMQLFSGDVVLNDSYFAAATATNATAADTARRRQHRAATP